MVSTGLRYGSMVGLCVWLVAICPPAFAQRQMENLGRGVVAVRTNSTTAYVGWRMLGTDPSSIGFNLYRSANGGAAVKLNSSPLTNTTDYVDSGATLSQSNVYYVKPVTNGLEWAASAAFTLPANAPVRQYFAIPFHNLTNGPVQYAQTAVGDLDGDGEYEYVVKWSTSKGTDPGSTHTNATDTLKLDAYKLDGTFLWRIDLGWNLEVGDDYSPVLVYDIDGDGRSEVMTKTAELTVDGTGVQIGDTNGDGKTDYRETSGRVLSGPEFLSIYRGSDGAELVRTNWIARGNVSDWGDGYGNRVSRNLMGIVYFDGTRPSIAMCRGVYALQKVEAWNYRSGSLSNLWAWSNGGSGPAGHQCIRMADVDGDGYDELIKGCFVLDQNGSVLWDTGLGHGDGLQVSVIDPSRAGLQIFSIREAGGNNGLALVNAANGSIIWGRDASGDPSRATASHIDARYTGLQCWAAASSNNLYNFDGSIVCSNSGPQVAPAGAYWNTLWFDTGLCRAMVSDHSGGEYIEKWVYGSCTTSQLMPATGSGVVRMTEVADVLGDWREEMMAVYTTELRVYTTAIPGNNRLYTLMHDKLYRLNVGQWAMRNASSSLPSFYLGTGMSAPPTPNIYFPTAVPPLPPSAPTGLTAAAVSPTQINLTWVNNATNATSVRIERSPDNSAFGEIGSVGSSVTNYADASLAPSTTYYYRVRARNAGGSSDYSNTASATTTSGPPGLTWRGDGTSNLWDIGTSTNWFNGASLVTYADGTAVTFDDTGTNSPSLGLVGLLQPSSMSVNAAKNYTLAGSGTLTGSMTLAKNGSGMLTVNTTNSYAGDTTLNSGTLAFGNQNALGTGTLTLHGGVLAFYSGGSLSNNISVAAPSLIVGNGNNTLNGLLLGSDTLTINTTANNVFTPQRDWSGFSGTILLGSTPGILRFNQGASTWGAPNAIVDAGSVGTVRNRLTGAGTVYLGALSGGAGSKLIESDQSSNPGTTNTYVIGGLDLDTTFAGTIQNGTNHPLTLVKVGSGVWTLSGTNSYTGGTVVSNGTLLVNNTTGSGTGTGAVTVVNGATLGGSGTLAGPVTVNGTLSPGDGVGVLTISNRLVVNGSAVLAYELGAVSDVTVVSGNLTLGGSLDVIDSGGFGAGSYTLFTYGGTLTYNGLVVGAVPAGYGYVIDTTTVHEVNLAVLSPFQQWQMNYFGPGYPSNPTAAANADPDGDGLDNQAEFLAGTNPTNSLSGLRIISVLPQGDGLNVTWTTAGGRTNAVQATAGDAGGGYTNNFVDITTAPHIIISGAGDTRTNHVDVGGSTNVPARYYRIRLVP